MYVAYLPFLQARENLGGLELTGKLHCVPYAEAVCPQRSDQVKSSPSGIGSTDHN